MYCVYNDHFLNNCKNPFKVVFAIILTIMGQFIEYLVLKCAKCNTLQSYIHFIQIK